ncbi:cell-envelope stress modulator CpxP [Enterobacteriaceae bacterium ESL0689]|nr:cell-envelope stress modulator CpxP [Enterobacteriaceae bacterium ESL0689]
MMCNVITAVIIASMLMLNLSVPVAQASNNWLMGDDRTQCSGQDDIFDGVSLTEHQRQKLRDLMQRVHRTRWHINISEAEAMYRLVTAEDFDEIAVRDQVNKIAQKQIAGQVELAKIRNYMYYQLTPEQQSVLNREHQQCMNRLRKMMTQENSATMLSANDNLMETR